MQLDNFLEFLRNSKRYSDRERRKVMKKYLASPELYREIFTPENSVDVVEKLQEMTERISRKRALKDMKNFKVLIGVIPKKDSWHFGPLCP